MRCAMRRNRLLRPISRSKRPCASGCAPSVREVRKQLKQQIPQASPQEAQQLAALDDYASGILTALNTDGVQPFKYAAVEAAQALDDVEASLGRLSKKGQP